MKNININSNKVSKMETDQPAKIKFTEYKQKKKQEEDDKIASIKPAQRIQKLKMDLGILAHDLFINKKIGKALYSKMMNSTYNRTREETLKSNIDVLNTIQDNAQTTVSKGEKLKKITHKNFKQIKTTKKADKSNIYNVYMKFNVTHFSEDEMKTIIYTQYILLFSFHHLKNE